MRRLLRRKKVSMINVVLERCAGIDVGKRLVVVCLMVGQASEAPRLEKRKFGVTTDALEQLRVWLEQEQVTHVVVESTGSYWKPIFNVLERSFTVVLANPVHVKNLRGHKTDMKDSEWLAHLLRHGLIRASFIPPVPIRELRSLTRQRRDLVAGGARERNRVQRLLEEANIKLGNVLSDLFGVSGQKMLEALVEGQASPAEIADLAVSRARKKIPELRQAIEGHRLTPSLRFLISQNLRHMEFIENEITALDEQIGMMLQTFTPEMKILETIPGIDTVSAATILAEIGADMKQFPTAAHLASWAGLCPGNNESAGITKSASTRRGNRTLCAMINQCAWAAAHTTNTVFQIRYQHLVPKRGNKRALVAVAHQLLVVIHTLLSRGIVYQDDGWTPKLSRRHYTRRARYHLHCLRRLRERICITEQTQI
jgi:transposase